MRQKVTFFLLLIKALKGVTDEEKQRNKAADDLFSSAVSAVKEPVEAFFAWLKVKTNIQRTYKCWSNPGRIIHEMGKIAIAFTTLISITDLNIRK